MINECKHTEHTHKTHILTDSAENGCCCCCCFVSSVLSFTLCRDKWNTHTREEKHRKAKSRTWKSSGQSESSHQAQLNEGWPNWTKERRRRRRYRVVISSVQLFCFGFFCHVLHSVLVFSLSSYLLLRKEKICVFIYLNYNLQLTSRIFCVCVWTFSSIFLTFLRRHTLSPRRKMRAPAPTWVPPLQLNLTFLFTSLSESVCLSVCICVCVCVFLESLTIGNYVYVYWLPFFNVNFFTTTLIFILL